MNILPFSRARAELDGQYSRMYEKADIDHSKRLYAELKAIYLNEEHATLGKGKALYRFLSDVELFINPYDIFADIYYKENTPLRIRKEIYFDYHKKGREARELTRAGAIFANGDYGHTMPDWNKLLTLGFGGIVNEALGCFEMDGLTDGQRAFYESVVHAYRGIIRLAERLSEAALAEEAENASFAAKNLSAIAKGAPQTLAEAMQLYFVYYTAQHHADGAVLRSLGSIDELLYPFYLKDKERGVTEAEVRELIKYFLYKWNSMRTEANIPFDISGTPNELTYIILEEYISLDVHDPKIHVKVKRDTPDRLIRTICDSIRRGNNSFVFINEDVTVASLMNIGISRSDAESYTLIGCYEPSAIGKELPCTVNGKLSLPMAVQFALDDICKDHPGSADDITFDDLIATVKDKIKLFADVSIKEISTIEKKYPYFMQSPTLSATYSDCMALGKDIYAGGAKYNNSSISAFGLATLTDELLAIKEMVYDKRLVTLCELYQILGNDWKGAEKLHTYATLSCKKYGTGDREADLFAADMVKFLSDTINNKPNGRGGVFRLGLFSIDWIFEFGKKLGASADGRHRGEPVSKNLSPSVGMDKGGVTAIMRSVMLQDHTLTPNGAVLDISLHPTTVSGDDGLSMISALIRTYFSGGGFAIQFNIVDRDTLIKARNEPEKYKNLQIRLCGWNVYFTDLEKDVQDNLIRSLG